MIELFDELPPTTRGQIVIPQFIYVKGGYGRELAKIINFYQTNVKHVNNNHILVKLLLSLNVSMNRDFQNYVDTAADAGLRLATSLRMTSSLSHGSLYSPGWFYGPNVTEVIIADDTEFDLAFADRNWRDLRPVRVLRHPFTDLSLGLADGNYEASDERGFAVISVNIPMLAAQYRGWYRDEKGDEGGSDPRRTILQFVAMYPIPNMLYSHLDIAIFNRMVARFNNNDVAPYRKSHPFFVIDYTARMDQVIEKHLGVIENRQLTFDHILASTPMVGADNLFEAMMLPKVVPTRQVKWALIIARLPVIAFLLQMNKYSDNQKNTWYLSRLRVFLRQMRNDRLLEQLLPAEVFAEIERFIYNEIEPCL